jgi:hypothetical protein
MRHLTIEDYHALLGMRDAPYPTHLQEHLETCGRCAGVYNILFAPARGGESMDDVAKSCPSCDDVYELFRNRLPLDRFVQLMPHLLRCEECGGFFDLFWARETPVPQATLVKEWLDSAGSALESAGRPREEIAACHVTNIYAYAASGEDVVIEVTGYLNNGVAFTLKYYPTKTVFRVAAASIGQIQLHRYSDNRWIDGWSETEDEETGCTLNPNAVETLHLCEPGGAVGTTIQTVPYFLFKKPEECDHAL